MKIDFKDPKTKALFEFYSKDEKEDFEGAYVYMKYLYEYVSIIFMGMGNPPIPELADVEPEVLQKIFSRLEGVGSGFGSNETSIYHSKILKLEDAEKLVTQEVNVNIDVPESIVPFKLAKDVILNTPDAIAVGTCPCRKANPESSCMPDPMEACMFLGDPHVSFIVAHNPKFRKVTQEEAVEILEDCHNRGFVHCAYFKRDMGSRLYAICNCCSCCCAGVKGIEMFRSGGLDFASTVSSGYVAVVGGDCVGCGECADCCSFSAISMNGDESAAIVDMEKCMGCGVCEGVCSSEAITLREEPSKGGVLDVEALKKMAG